jgi:glutaredoxin
MENISTKPPVTLYVVPGCPLCARARGWLEQHGIEYAERDVTSDFGALRAMYRLTKQGLVPVFEYTGQALVRPTEDQLSRLLLT